MRVGIEEGARRLAQIAQICGAAVLFALLVLTCADVIGRYLLLQPVNGKTELTRMMMAAMIALALPVVSGRGDQITIDLFDHFFRGRVKALRDLIVDGIAAVAFLVLAWWVGFRAQRLMEYGYVSDFLHLPLHPIAYFVAAMIGVTGLTLAVKAGLDAVRLARGGELPEQAEPPHQRPE